MGFFKSALTASLLLASNVAALDRVSAKGTKFFKANGDEFFIKGVAYQQDSAAAGGESKTGTYKDPLADEKACARDVPILKDLGANAIRTYAIDPTLDHSACMKLLIDAGIYVISDLSEPSTSINRDDPGWDVTLYKRYTAVIDELSKYENVIGFFAGNEVSNNVTNTGASAFVKAAVRDSKAYIKKNYAKLNLGVGYACNDDDKIRAPMAQYFNCGPTEQSIDFWGYNIYSWCPPSSFQQSGYDVQVKFFSNYSVPVFFAEYGCNTGSGGAESRTWEEVDALYGDQMTGVFSGGIVYMYDEEANDYGLVKLNGDSASTMKNYDALKTRLAGVSPSSTSAAAYTPTNSAAACPGIQTNWKASEKLPPTPDTSVCDCMYNSLSCSVADNVDAKDYGDIFGFICGNKPDACKGIKQDTQAGSYGPYVMCNAKQKLGNVLDAYYKSQNSASSACDFNGKAKVNSSPSATGQCSAIIASASSAADAVASQTGSSSSRASSSSPAVAMKMDRMLTLGDFAIGLYVVVAMATGAGMVML